MNLSKKNRVGGVISAGMSIFLCLQSTMAAIAEVYDYNGLEVLVPAFRRAEVYANAQREEGGDIGYLLGIYDFKEINEALGNYLLYGKHPEPDIRDSFPNQAERDQPLLPASRVFVLRNYLAFWAASLILKNDKSVRETADTRMRILTQIYHEDIAVQRLVADLIMKHGNDDTPLYANVKASEIVRHMKERIENSTPQDWENRPMLAPEDDPFSPQYKRPDKNGISQDDTPAQRKDDGANEGGVREESPQSVSEQAGDFIRPWKSKWYWVWGIIGGVTILFFLIRQFRTWKP